jgi:glyoxylate reductase
VIRPKILLTREIHDFALADLQKRYDVFVHSGAIPMPRDKLIRRIKNVDGLVCFPYDTIDAGVINSAKNLTVISTYSVGYDHIDVSAAKRRGIKIGYTPEVLTNATADLTIALMLDVMRKVTQGDRLIRAGGWKVIFGAHDYVGTDLEAKTFGILGMGRIGKAVAKRALSFGMNVDYHSRSRLPRNVEKRMRVRHVSFDDLIKNSDVLSIHVPHNKETDRLINRNVLKKMKKTAFLINTARGKIVNQDDLIAALEKNAISGAGLDVFEREPIGKRHPLAKMNNVVLAPHIGSSTAETRKKMAEITVQNLVFGLEGKKMTYSV